MGLTKLAIHNITIKVIVSMKPDKSKNFDVITVGSDPEFLVQSGGRTQSAYTFFRGLGNTNPSGDCDCGDDCCSECFPDDDDYGGMGIEVGGAGNIGWDGCDSTGEMRPKHSMNPVEHVENIAAMLRFVHGRNRIVKLMAVNHGAGVTPTGGHLHLGFPRGEGYSVDGLLDLASAMLLPMIAADGDKEFAAKRVTNSNRPSDRDFAFRSYGCINDWRSASRGSSTVYEFRAPSSTWLSTFELAFCTVATAGAIVEGLLKLQKDGNIAALKERMKPFSSNLFSLQRLALLDKDGALFSPIAKKITKEIKGLPTYEKWRTEIEHAFNLKWQKRQVLNGGMDIIKGWGLRHGRRVPLYVIKKGASIDESQLAMCKDGYAPAHGSELNVSCFALEMAKAIMVLGWQPKKTYYLFGVRQGNGGYVIANANSEASMVVTGEGVVSEATLSKAIQFARTLVPRATTVAEKRCAVAIGIPYELREKLDVRGFLELVWRIDNDTVKLTSNLNDVRAMVPPPAPVLTTGANSPSEGTSTCAAS